MKNIFSFAILLTFCFGKANSQDQDAIKVDFNHIFFCVDSITYDNLFKHEFIAKIFANSREDSSKTLTDSWTGKYLFGRQSYVEVFKPRSDQLTNQPLGDKFGDLGIVFKTKKPGDIKIIEDRINNNKRNTQLKLNEMEFEGKVIPFTYNLYLSNAELEETFRPYVDERTAQFFKLNGFSESEIKAGITHEQFANKFRGKKYEKLYDDVEKIELTVTNEEFEYLAESLKYFGFTQVGYRFTANRGFEIICSLQQNRKYKLNSIHFALLKNTEDVNIEVSRNLTFKASGTRAVFQFSY